MDAAYLGIIEGFYGKRYATEEREAIFNFAANNGYSFYIYAPKADKQLRDEWLNEISQEYKEELKDFASKAHASGIDFGVALSPLKLTANFEENQAVLLERVKELCAASSCDIFCLLFDDMVKDSEDFGKVQNKIIKLVESQLPEHVKHFIICPSYYTDDPILDKLFGQRPEHYFEDLLEGMPERVNIFWTGPEVLSKDITVEHLEYVTKLLCRKPFIWDNYPVNDGKKIHNFLYINKFQGRRGLAPYVTGHAVNPMVQPLLSTLAEVTLPLIYQDKTNEEINFAHLQRARELFGKATSMIIKYDNLDLLTRIGLNNMSTRDKVRFLEFSQMEDRPALKELADFIQGDERFDQTIINGTHIITQA
ncbi:beta-N-acetylglucosaminidase domain-containing protein [Anaerobiospirillum succiniciproducens]|uniref:beta-N-acetylglucosaminidase domain-containing protein n=1 Tax=Anaerobiospirillum succiniciproducens TaxID=13335 RepID=UPI0004169CDE|nr:beta-N-acetylglucosaminidase domain-containing protein [Anaerobiospirillum succiniciproducens]